jgi:hypothetical protein
MPGDDRVRFCMECGQSVYNLSVMSRAEAEAFVTSKEGPGCVRFYRRDDGTIQTRDCPRAAEMLARGTRYTAARLLAFALLILGLAFVMVPKGDDDEKSPPLRSVEPFKTAMDWLDPPQPKVLPLRCVMGKPAPPPPPKTNN